MSDFNHGEGLVGDQVEGTDEDTDEMPHTAKHIKSILPPGIQVHNQIPFSGQASTSRGSSKKLSNVQAKQKGSLT